METLLTFKTKSRSPGLQISAPIINPTLAVSGTDVALTASEFRRTSTPPPSGTSASTSGHSRNFSAPSSAMQRAPDFGASLSSSSIPSSSGITHPPASSRSRPGRALSPDFVRVQRGAPGAEFDFPRPTAEEIDVLFESVQITRNITPLSREFTGDEKWLLALSDARMRWLDDKKPAKSTAVGGAHSATNGVMFTEDLPESYLKMFMNSTITHKQVAALRVSLRIRPLSWLQSFLSLEGIFILALELERISTRERGIEDLFVEHEILKCLRGLANSQDDSAVIQHQQSINYIACSLSTPNLASRRLVADILRCCVNVNSGLPKVITAFETLSSINNDTGTFKYWLKSLNATLLDSDGIYQYASDTMMTEYTVMNFRLINTILEKADVPDLRMQLRSQMVVAGVAELLEHARRLRSPIVNKLLDVYEREAKKDHQQLIQRVNQDILSNMQDPQEICRAILSTVEGSPAHAHFLSTMQHLLLIRAEGDQRTRYYQLIDTLVTSVVLDSRTDLKGTLSEQVGASVERLVAQLDGQWQAMQAISDAATDKLRVELEQVKGEMVALLKDVTMSEDGLIGKLKAQLAGAEDQLKTSQQLIRGLTAQFDEQGRMHVEEVRQLEMQTQGLFSMLRAAGGNITPANTADMDRTKLISMLQLKQMEHRGALTALQRTRTKREPRRSAMSRPARIPEEEIGAEDEEGEESKSKMSVGRDGNLRSRKMKPQAPLQSSTKVAEEDESRSRTEETMQGSGPSSTENDTSDTRRKLGKPWQDRRDARAALYHVKLADQVTENNRLAVVVRAKGTVPPPRKVTPPPLLPPGDSTTPRSLGDRAAVTSGSVSSDTTLSDLVDDSSDSDYDTNTLNGDYSAAVPDQGGGIERLDDNDVDTRQRHFSTLTFESGTVYDDGDPNHVAAKDAYYGGDDTVSIRSFNSILL